MTHWLEQGQQQYLTPNVSRLSEDFNVKGAGYTLVDRCLVSFHHAEDRLPQAAQVIEDLKRRSHLRRVLRSVQRKAAFKNRGSPTYLKYLRLSRLKDSPLFWLNNITDPQRESCCLNNICF